MLQFLVFLGFICAVYGTVIYFKDTLSGRVKPNKVGWLMWSIAPLIATVAALSKGVTWAVLPVFMSGFGPLCIFIASLFSKKAYWEIKLFDYLCGFLSALALILWLITKEANIAIVLAIASDAFAAIPTLKKAWTNPESESATLYLTFLISALTSFAAIEYWVFPQYAFAVYLVFINISLLFAISYGKVLNISKSN